MVIDVTRSHIKVGLFGKTVTLLGEMFFPENGKLGFAIFRSQAKFWDAPNGDDAITEDELTAIVTDIRADFAKGGHTLEVE
jgi:Immunity protein 74